MNPLFATILKELRLLRRDLHGLALLFILPLVFILIMSLALQDLFASRAGHLADVLLIDHDGTPKSKMLQESLAKNEAFGIKRQMAPKDLKQALKTGGYAFAIEIRKGYGASLEGQPDPKTPTLLAVTVAPDTDKRTEKLMLAALGEATGLQRTQQLIGFLPTEDPFGYPIDPPKVESPKIDLAYAYAPAKPGASPSAVQQSVPAWLVFAIFFVSIPFSNTFIRERQLGVQRRLATIDVGPLTQFLGKLIPYFLVNQIQVVLMLAAGMFLVPLLGGQALQLNGSPFALVLLSAAVSLAALGLALLIAVTARTSEQATMASGLGAIVLAALGGIMIPKFVMPQGMQAIADLSPMAWGLDGFLGLLLRGGGVGDIWGELVKLTAFGAATLGAAWLVHRYQK
ncbi:MAG: type transporter [Caulobacter sp.]|nr:type transporter [Caulobacter sp.]